MSLGIDDDVYEDILLAADSRYIEGIFEGLYGIAVDLRTLSEVCAECSSVAVSYHSVLGHSLHRIDIEAVPECLVRLDGEEFFHSLPHHSLIQAAGCHIPVGICISEEYDVYALACGCLLQGNDLSVL